MSELTVDVPGGRLFVRDLGSGPAILLLHASIVDSWAWEPLTPDVAHMIALEAPAELAAEIVALLAPLELWS